MVQVHQFGVAYQRAGKYVEVKKILGIKKALND